MQKILSEHVPECEVRVFGSRVTGHVKPWSDLDLALIGKEPLGFRRIGLLKEALQESTLPFRVDVLDWYETSPSSQAVINQKYTVIQTGQTAGAVQ